MEIRPHYSEILKELLGRKTAENPRFSLRSYARVLGMSAAQLSRIITRKAPLTLKMATRISPLLFSSASGKRDLFIEFVQLCNIADPDETMLGFLYQKLLSMGACELDQIRLRCLSDWSVVATFDAFGLVNSPRSCEELACMLGISEREASVAVRQLEHAQLLEPAGGWYRRKVERFYTTCDVPSAVIRSLHRQLIGKAMQSVEGQDVSQRYLRGMSVSLKPSLLPRVRELVESFCQEVEKLEKQSVGQAEALYQLNVQFFDLLQRQRIEKKDEIA